MRRRRSAAAPSCRWCLRPGEAFQFDWSEDWALHCGRARQAAGGAVQALATAGPSCCGPTCCKPTRCCSMRTATPSRVLGGVPRRGIYDNMKTAVDRVGRGKAREVNARFAAMVSHYLFEAEFCNPGVGLGEGADREERAGCAAPDVAGGTRVSKPAGAQCLARMPLHRALAGTAPPRAAGSHDRTRCGAEEQPLLMHAAAAV